MSFGLLGDIPIGCFEIGSSLTGGEGIIMYFSDNSSRIVPHEVINVCRMVDDVHSKVLELNSLLDNVSHLGPDNGAVIYCKSELLGLQDKYQCYRTLALAYINKRYGLDLI